MPDLVVHAFTDGRDTLPDCRRGLPRARRGLVRDAGNAARSAASSGATSRWTATALGAHAARLRPARPRPRPSTTPTPARRPCAPPTSATRPTSSSPPRPSARRRGSGPGDSVIAFNFRPDRMRQITQALADAGLRRGRPRRRPRVERYATLTEYEEDWPYPVAFPPERPTITLPSVIADARRAPAARRRDGEVPARDVLLRRRRGGPVRRASGASSCPRRATCRPTTTSRR